MLLAFGCMTTSLVTDARKRLRVFQGQYPAISRSTGLSYSWLTKFAQGKMTNPTLRNLGPLLDALDSMEAEQAKTHHHV